MLPAEQCEALLLVGANGFRYEDAALLVGCAAGTMKSRVSRGRAKLREALENLDQDDVSPGGVHETADGPSKPGSFGRACRDGQDSSCARPRSMPVLRKSIASHRAA
jgi:hypothetical protein